MIDWNPIIIAIIALISTIITTLIPVAIKAFFDAHTAQIESAKAVIDRNQEIVSAIVTVIQQTMGAIGNSAKYQIALQRVDEVLNLPAETAHDMIELAVAEAKLAWGDEWTELAVPADPLAVPSAGLQG